MDKKQENEKKNSEKTESKNHDSKKDHKLNPKDQKILDLENKIKELTDSLLRLQAEFDNFRKRGEKERTQIVKFASSDMINKLLPTLDSFDQALKNAKGEEAKGIKLLYGQLWAVLHAEGLNVIKCVGEKFDPFKHEVLMKEESDKVDDTILEEFQKGYTLNDQVLRHSKVKVSGK